jgi:hypothetical protein
LDSTESSVFETVCEFSLPLGYVDSQGTCHKEGTMRLATAGDEILCNQDPRVINNPSYAVCILLARVITKLGSLDTNQISPKIIEKLFLKDMLFLKGLYQQINFGEGLKVTCPKCQDNFNLELQNLD